MLFNNAQACMSWLSYLQKECGAEPLLGKDLTRVAQQVWKYNCAGDMLNFYGEIPFLGSQELDISCQYLASLFAKGNAFRRHELEMQGELFTAYSQRLAAALPNAYKDKSMFLEADTSRAGYDTLSVFYNVENEYLDVVLPMLFAKEHYPDMLQEVRRLVALLEPFAKLWQVGFMQSRENKPLRLVFDLNNQDIDCILVALRIPSAAKIRMHVEALVECDVCLITMLNLDLIPGVGVGSTLGLEMTLKSVLPERQKQLCKTKGYEEFKHQLLKCGVADQRVHCLEKCIFSRVAPDSYQAPYHMYSVISHFKLQWKNGKQLPAKAYLRMRPIPLQGSINISV